MCYWYLVHDTHIRVFTPCVKYWSKYSRPSAPRNSATCALKSISLHTPGIFMHCLHSSCVYAIAIWRKFHASLLWWFCAFQHAVYDTIYMLIWISRAFVVFGIASHLACDRSSDKNRHVSLDAWTAVWVPGRARRANNLLDSGSTHLSKNGSSGIAFDGRAGIDLCGSWAPIRTARFAADEIAELLFAVGAQ